MKASENGSEVGFYLLPKSAREPSPPSSHHLQHRLSIIKEVREDSSASSSPRSSPKPLWKNTGLNHNRIEANWQGKLENKQYSDYINPNTGVKGENENLTGQQDIVIHTAGRGDGCTNQSSQR
jgi:hypothetical protein